MSDIAPFVSALSLRNIPLGFVADAVQGGVDAIELACLWSDERGSAELWYRVLNVGVPMAISPGTDVMNNLYHTMAIGTARVYVHPDRPSDAGSYFAALKAGRSFVSTGPMVDFHVGSAGPGQAVARGNGTATWQLDAHSAMPVDSVQIVVNGIVVQTLPPFKALGSKHYSGTLLADGWLGCCTRQRADHDGMAWDVGVRLRAYVAGLDRSCGQHRSGGQGCGSAGSPARTRCCRSGG